MPSITYASELDQLRQQLTVCLSLVDDQAEQIRQLTTENTEFRVEIADLREENDRLYSRINTQEDEKRYEDRLFKVEAAHLSPADKLIIREVRHLNRRTKDDPYAHNRVCLSVLAQNVGASESTIGRRVKMLAQANFIETVTTPPTKDDDRSHLDIALLPILDDPDDIKREQEREHGGARLCEKCGSERKNRYSVHVCKECQDVTIHDLPGNTIPLAFQDAFSIVITAEQTQDAPVAVESHELHTTNVENGPVSLDIINALVAIMNNYRVKHMPGMTCTCGCQLWRNVLGEFACCKCEPSNLWPDAYNNLIKVLYPDRQRR